MEFSSLSWKVMETNFDWCQIKDKEKLRQVIKLREGHVF